MTTRIEDRAAITDLMNGWIHRDLNEWAQLSDLFHPGATIAITWFDGPVTDFIEGSARMGSSDLRTKHFVGHPSITFNGNRALVQTNAMIVADERRPGPELDHPQPLPGPRRETGRSLAHNPTREQLRHELRQLPGQGPKS